MAGLVLAIGYLQAQSGYFAGLALLLDLSHIIRGQ
jgi:hypothetical protein